MCGKHYIYGLVDPVSMAVRYIGRAVNPSSRYRKHVNEKGDSKKCKWISELAEQGKKPTMVILEETDAANVKLVETKWIEKLSVQFGWVLVNTQEVPAAASPSPAPMPAPLDPANYEITSGYVGSLGKTYKPATAETLTEAIAAAAQRHNVSATIIEQRLRNGESVEWCDSPNRYYDHSRGVIRPKRTTKPVQLVKCRCGHSVPRAEVMSTSMGTSCPDCYDRMSN